MKTKMRITAVLVAGLMLAAGCTANDDKKADKESAPAVTKPESGDEGGGTDSEMVEGCENGWTDPEDLAEDRDPARCEPGFPAPVPLAEKTKVTITTSTLNAEFIAVLRYAAEHGEFEKENLDVVFEQIPPTEAYPLLAQGRVDATWSAPDAAFVNSVDGGFDLKWVLSNFSVSPDSKTGFWVNTGGDPDWSIEDLEGASMGTVIGKGSVAAYPINAALEDANLSINDLEFETLPAADLVTALTNGGIDSSWVLDPLWVDLEDEENVRFITGQPLGEPLGGLVMGPSLLRDNPDAGVALIRAYIRTVNTYFAGDYKEDAERITEVAELLELPEENLLATPAPIWDWEIRSGSIDRLQNAYLVGGTLETDEPMPEDELVDRSLYAAAVGHSGS